MSTPPASCSAQFPQAYLQQLEKMREMVRAGRSLLPAHAEFKPDWDRHLQRLDNIERFVRQGKPANMPLIQQLHDDFMLEYQADMANTMSETSARLVRFNDMLAQKLGEKKFELPAEVRDDLEDLLQPYHDTFREKMLSELPIEERRAIEAHKRRLEEDE